MVGELGCLAQQALRDPAEALGPYVELSLDLRDRARAEGRFADADAVRDRLRALGVEIHDGADGFNVGAHKPDRPLRRSW